MVEITDGEVLLRTEKLDVTLVADVEHLGAVEVRALRGWGMSPLHVHERHAEALFVLEGDLVLRLEDRQHPIGAQTWVLVPPQVVHAFEVAGDEPARFLSFHTPSSGFGDYVRTGVPFDQQPPPEYAGGDPELVAIRAAGEGEKVTDRPERRATLLVDADELVVSEFVYGSGERGAPRHVHRQHADAFLVLDGEFTFHLRDGSQAVPGPALVLFPPGVVHGFDNDSSGTTRAFNLHMPATGFAGYLRGRNPGFDQHDPPEDGGVDPSEIVAVRLSVDEAV
jgi:quercetin dioxygenase-like cupin family protein